jgi:L-arabinonolactonase
MTGAVACVVDSRNKLGEVPVWDVAEQALYWVDIEGMLLQRYRPATGQVDKWQMPERIACFALREKGG